MSNACVCVRESWRCSNASISDTSLYSSLRTPLSESLLTSSRHVFVSAPWEFQNNVLLQAGDPCTDLLLLDAADLLPDAIRNAVRDGEATAACSCISMMYATRAIQNLCKRHLSALRSAQAAIEQLACPSATIARSLCTMPRSVMTLLLYAARRKRPCVHLTTLV